MWDSDLVARGNVRRGRDKTSRRVDRLGEDAKGLTDGVVDEHVARYWVGPPPTRGGVEG